MKFLLYEIVSFGPEESPLSEGQKVVIQNLRTPNLA